MCINDTVMVKIKHPSSDSCFLSDGVSLRDLRTPVNITLRRFAHGSDAVPACWNFSLAGGLGGWRSEGCRIQEHQDNFTTISCNSLSNYGLLMVGGVRLLLSITRKCSHVSVIFILFMTL